MSDDTSGQMAAPLLEQLQQCAHQSSAAFHTPGHKRGQGTPVRLKQWLGGAVFQADLPELPELDNLFAPEGVIQQAQELAAAAFGAEQTWFLANGSTCGIEAAVLTTCDPGSKLILPRNVHQSAIAALILAGAVPVFVEPDYDAATDLVHGVSPTALAATIEQHPDAKAVLIVSPTYHGVVSPVQELAALAHCSNMPLLVDEAHGAHFAFHPELPASALSLGADLVVQSIHKTLSALTQAAMLHVQGARIDRQRLNRSLQLVQSTSPNYLLLASLDAARQQMATQGQMLMQHALNLAKRARGEISQIPGLAVLAGGAATGTGFADLDLTRLTVDVTGLGITGFAADQQLHETLGVTVELPSLHHLTLIVSLGNTEADIDRLVRALQILAEAASWGYQPNAISRVVPPLRVRPQTVPNPLTPRQAFFYPTQIVPIAQAIGQISAELVCPYPPGIPVLVPGEVITGEAIEYLQQILAVGGMVTGCADSSLQTVNIVQPEAINRDARMEREWK